MKVLLLCFSALICALSAVAALAAAEDSTSSTLPHTTNERLCNENEGTFSASSGPERQRVTSGAATTRHLQAWRSRGGARSYSNSYTPSYSSTGSSGYTSPTYTMRSSPYSGTYAASTTYSRATPTYSSTGVSYPASTSSGTTYYGGGNSATTYAAGGLSSPTYTGTSRSTTTYTGSSMSTPTYTGSSVSTPTYVGYSGGSRATGGTPYMRSSSTPYYSTSSSQPSYSGTAYSGSNMSFSGATTATYSGVSGGSGAGRAFMTSPASALRTVYPSGSSSVMASAPSPVDGAGRVAPMHGSSTPTPNSGPGESTSGALRSRSGIPARASFGSGSTSAVQSATTASSARGRTSGFTHPAATRPSPASTPATHNSSGSGLTSTPSASTNTPSPAASVPETNVQRGNSSFRSFNGASTVTPVAQQQQAQGATTYYLREADGSLTPIEPPPYDQMKPDSYYTDLYLTDKPIRFENQATKEQQFKRELEKAHATNIEIESRQPKQGVMSLPVTVEKKGVM
ncbi:hypothetical protein, conserved [Eimeria tenella]|uniref:Uncharacterized protein n=1 Tax=Eimeria tenella TaxID=5802 RepID=U6KU97_EIMTE|nr:hypothetical protein, conserved [Eimeria tenella]CDJ40483.1 hypothetical protein, conserved [Eimeria tenella]|eukprot:XP_013231233.1 hypothetical protein, conserved [Eimeria tenella]